MAWLGMIWTPYDWLNKFYDFYIAGTIGIVSRCGLNIDTHGINNLMRVSQYCMSHYFHFNSCLKQLYNVYTWVTSWSTSIIKVGVAYMSVLWISEYLKEELPWATDKWLWVINMMLFKTVVKWSRKLLKFSTTLFSWMAFFKAHMS